MPAPPINPIPANLLDQFTWTPSSLSTPEGPITYWQLSDLRQYTEKFARDGNLTRTLLAVAWADATNFKWYALGFSDHRSGATYFERYTPLLCPYTESQYLVQLEKAEIHVGLDPTGNPIFAAPDPDAENWFTLPPTLPGQSPGETRGFPPRIIYHATFGNLPYKVVDQDTFRNTGALNEQRRFVIKRRRVNARERKIPGWTFETDDVAATPIPEVGFVPYYDYQFTWTWVGIPEDDVPDTAIANCLVKINNAPFGYKRDGTYGKYQTGDLLFEGLASEITPYRGPNSEWLVDLPYVFRYQPADGAGNGMLKVPRNDGTWIKARARGTAGSPKYMFFPANFEALFQPEP